MVSGAFWINKPAGLTSSDVVVRLKIAMTKNGYAEKGFKIGHGGTLDPFATGALVVLVGEATKLADTYLHSKKTYSGIIALGTRTDTADLTGEKIESLPVPPLKSEEWNSLAKTFVTNEYWQVPPMYSAKKKDGKALHELARQGVEVERKPILKKIESFTVGIQDQELSFLVHCESGTYVRVIAEDLAKKAGTLAHLRVLVREQSSDVVLSKCDSLDQVLNQLNGKTELTRIPSFHPLQEVSTHLNFISVSESEANSMLQGQSKIVLALIERFKSNFHPDHPAEKYFLTRLPSGLPTALFERTSPQGPIQNSTYRLQRMILWN